MLHIHMAGWMQSTVLYLDRHLNESLSMFVRWQHTRSVQFWFRFVLSPLCFLPKRSHQHSIFCCSVKISSQWGPQTFLNHSIILFVILPCHSFIHFYLFVVNVKKFDRLLSMMEMDVFFTHVPRLHASLSSNMMAVLVHAHALATQTDPRRHSYTKFSLQWQWQCAVYLYIYGSKHIIVPVKRSTASCSNL